MNFRDTTAKRRSESTASSRPESRGLHPVGALACTHKKQSLPIGGRQERQTNDISGIKIRIDCKQSARISGTTPSGCACAHPPEEKCPDWRKAGDKAKSTKDPNGLQAIGPNLEDYTQWVRLRAPTGRKSPD